MTTRRNESCKWLGTKTRRNESCKRLRTKTRGNELSRVMVRLLGGMIRVRGKG